MDSLITTQEAVELKANEAAEMQALVELSAHELSLVGGGTANVAFL